MKNLKKVLALVLAVVMIMGVVATASAKDYTDVKGTDTYADAIDALSSLKILDGFEDGTFKADGTLNRAQAAKIVAIVHNAATNGKIQSDIADLYANAQNPFVDCNNSWALPYINYCRITGLADGMTATTYAPKRELTGVQWLKLMLTTLNFDTAKEGYTGTGWDINVLNRANEIGLTAGLKDGWKAIAPIKRGEAAQILYNALTAYLVEYGQLVKGFQHTDAAVFNAAFVSNEQVAKSGFTLGAKMGIKMTRKVDVFMRPGYQWSYGSWSAFYMDAPVAEYTAKTTVCDILVDGAKIPTTSNATVPVYYFRNGTMERKVNETASHLRTTTATDLVCDTTLGGNGALTQVFKVAYVAKDNSVKAAYVVTVIDTFLAKVDAVTSSKHNNTSAATSINSTSLSVYADAAQKFTNKTFTARVKGFNDYAKNDVVLFNFAQNDWGYLTVVNPDNADNKIAVVAGVTKAYDNTNRTVYTVDTYAAGQTNIPTPGYAINVQKAGTIESATFSGQSANRDTFTVNGTKTPVNCTYTKTGIFLRPADYVNQEILKGKLSTNFYTDQYGNVIGDSNVFASNYAIVDAAKWVNDGDLQVAGYAQFALVGVDAKTTYATVTSYRGLATAAATANNAGELGAKAYVAQDPSNNGMYTSAAYNFGVVKYTESDGKYSLAKPAHMANIGACNVKNGKVEIAAATDAEGDHTVVYANNETKFVVLTVVDGANVYTAYEGIDSLPTMSNVTAGVAIWDGAEAKFASFVYLIADNAIFEGSDTIAYVLAADAHNYYAEYGVVYTYRVFINGVETLIEADGSNPAVNKADRLFEQGEGVYTLHFLSGDKKVSSATKVDTTSADAKWRVAEVETVESNGMLLKTHVIPFSLTDAKIFVVDGNEVKAATSADIADGATVTFKTVSGKNYVVDTIFVVNP